MIDDLKFNWCLPREYKDKDTGEIKYALCTGGEKMNIGSLADMQAASDSSKPKNAQPWGQVFANGYRVTSDRLDYADWQGVTFADVDSKWFYKLCKPFDVDKLLNGLYTYGPIIYEDNFLACHLTNSKQSYRIFWYWKCERTKENFIKCCLLTEKYTRELFYQLGEQAKMIIDFNEQGHRVLDKCSNSVMQGFYITNNPIYVYSNVENDNFGNVDLSDIEISQVYENSSIAKTFGDFKQYEHSNFKCKHDVEKKDIKYYPHQLRRCLYEALAMLFNDKETVDNEWKYISSLLPEGNGHDRKFYENEPTKCKWFDKINYNVFHRLDWLDALGYEYEDNTEYIYYKHFRKSWKNYVRTRLINKYLSERITAWEKDTKMKWEDLKKSEQEEKYEEWKKEVNIWDIFDKLWDEKMDNKEYLDDQRRLFWKTRWECSEFQYLCTGYEIAKDVVTYKMYADFYYRDRNNVPTIKYDVLEDQINVIGYWPETNKIQWHPYKYNDEYTHWKNKDTFSNKAVKNDIMYAVNKFVPRWFSYHTIKDYLNGLDLSKANEDLLETWAIRYFNAPDTKLIRTMSKNYFIAAVKKQMIEDPTQFVFQHMLFIVGPTNCGKTTFLVTMFTINGHSFILNKIDPNGKDNEIGPLIAKNWLIQFGESENLKKVSVNAVKEFIDRINLGMKYQKKYENEQTTIYPRIMACRTSNDDILFNDVSVSVDKRNWLIECNVPENWWNDSLQKQLEDEKDTLWATAYKLYLDNPDASLELPNDLFEELGKMQESHKLITNSEIEEIYNEIFERDYMTNYKGHIVDETSFRDQLKRSDKFLDSKLIESNLSTEMLTAAKESGYVSDEYTFKRKLTRIPSRWIKSYITEKYGISTWKLLKDYLERHGWNYKVCGWNDSTLNCYEKNYKKL